MPPASHAGWCPRLWCGQTSARSRVRRHLFRRRRVQPHPVLLPLCLRPATAGGLSTTLASTSLSRSRSASTRASRSIGGWASPSRAWAPTHSASFGRALCDPPPPTCSVFRWWQTTLHGSTWITRSFRGPRGTGPSRSSLGKRTPCVWSTMTAVAMPRAPCCGAAPTYPCSPSPARSCGLLTALQHQPHPRRPSRLLQASPPPRPRPSPCCLRAMAGSRTTTRPSRGLDGPFSASTPPSTSIGPRWSLFPALASTRSVCAGERRCDPHSVKTTRSSWWQMTTLNCMLMVRWSPPTP